MKPGSDTNTRGAITGWQGLIVGSNVSNTGTPTTADVSGGNHNNVGVITPLAGNALAAGTYYYFIPCAGCAAVDVVLRTSAGGANVTASSTKIWKTLTDGVTEKMNATGSSAAVAFSGFSDGTQQTVSITNLRGELGVLLKIVTTSTGTTFDQAEYSAL